MKNCLFSIYADVVWCLTWLKDLGLYLLFMSQMGQVVIALSLGVIWFFQENKNVSLQTILSHCEHLRALQNSLVINLIFALKFGLLISIRPFIWYIKVHNIPSPLLSLTSLSSHLKHPIILIFVKLAQFSQYMHCNPFLHHAMLAPFQSYLNFLETLDCLWNWFSYFLFLLFKMWLQSQILSMEWIYFQT